MSINTKRDYTSVPESLVTEWLMPLKCWASDQKLEIHGIKFIINRKLVRKILFEGIGLEQIISLFQNGTCSDGKYGAIMLSDNILTFIFHPATGEHITIYKFSGHKPVRHRG